MSLWKLIWQYEFIALCRRKGLLLGLILLFLSGLYAIHYGHSFVEHQRDVLYQVDTLQTANYSKTFQKLSEDTVAFPKKQPYNAYMSDWGTQKMVTYAPSGFAALSIGQKDNFSFYHNVFILNSVFNNKLQEIRNPDKLLAGNFDLAFVILYLFPLLVIALGYNVLSEEKESYTYKLLKVHAPSVHRVVVHKLTFRFFVTFLLLFVLSLIGFVVNRIDVGGQMVIWLLASKLYLLFWYSLVYLFTSFNTNGTANALALLASWILVLLFIPTTVNFAANHDEGSGHLELVSVGRENSSIYSWPTRQLLDSLYIKSPAFSKANYSIKDSTNLKLVGYVEMSHARYNSEGLGLLEQQRQTYERTLDFNMINPAYTVLHVLNQVAQTELNHYQHYMKAALEYQQARRYYIFDYLLAGRTFGADDYKGFPQFELQLPSYGLSQAFRSLLPLFFLVLLFAGAGYLFYRKV
ncbi:DUF3526 domain-containing protein [Pontibacter sp. SGAir0037]|uniref:DUF3526 domain-containing protein n=1 Tax=Pontibacter sp. SGAir0037 TaxID=2571030 RepID=UPI0010CD2907|nr:DUF3526 domain-containing protein [Pontibacter sp. SGAir0037]QCR21620.1 hypothetical protein C1N53_04180 [Pontibacter sp. SGAir0037]